MAVFTDESVSFSDALVTNCSIIHRAVKSFGQSCTLITLRGEEFVLTSVNSVVIAELVVMFLEELKKRSRFAVAMHEKKSQGKPHNFSTGWGRNHERIHSTCLKVLKEETENFIKSPFAPRGMQQSNAKHKAMGFSTFVHK